MITGRGYPIPPTSWCPFCGGQPYNIRPNPRLSFSAVIADCSDCLRTFEPYGPKSQSIAAYLSGTFAPVSHQTAQPWIHARDRYLCRVPDGYETQCLAPATEIDHIVPVSRGGGNEATNLRSACGPCNRRKRNRLDSEMYPPKSAREWELERRQGIRYL